MGKRYYCDYCDKTMVAAPAIVRKHNNGVGHQSIATQHYQQFKEPETVLKEESVKRPCLRFMNSECVFGGICRFSHYTSEQIHELRRIVAEKNAKKANMVYPSFMDLVHNILNEKTNNQMRENQEADGNTMIYDNNGITHVLPWTYNPVLESYGENLPPSVKRMKVDDFNNVKIVSWG